MDAATAAILGASIGVIGGVASAYFTNRLQRASLREARREERRATAYFEMALMVMRLEQFARAVAYPNEAAPPTLRDEPNWDRFLSAEGHAYVFASREVRRLYDEVAVALRRAIEPAGKSPIAVPLPDAGLAVVRQMVPAVTDAVRRLFAQMNAELHPDGKRET